MINKEVKLTIMIDSILKELENRIDIIENASRGNLTEFQCGYLASMNEFIDLLIREKEKSSPDPIKKEVVMSPGFTLSNLGKKRKEKIDSPKQDNRKHRFTWKRK